MNSQDLSKLRETVQECADRCLHTSSRWAAELYSSAPKSAVRESSAHRSGINANLIEVAGLDLNSRGGEAEIENPQLLNLARTYFCSKQFDRAAFILTPCNSPNAVFLKGFSRFMSTERRSATNKPVFHSSDPEHQKSSISALHQETLLPLNASSDPYILLLRGMILSRVGHRPEAIACLIQCTNTNPWIWSAWLVLSGCIEDTDEFIGIQRLLPRHPMSELFGLRVMVELHSPSDEDLRTIESLLTLFPASLYLLGQKALIHYHQKEWSEAEQLYDYILKKEPYRIDDMDVYSNILHVMEKRTKLSKLAHDLLAVDKDRPEVCCIVGNHYSLRGEHERAVKYFERAVHLDATYLSAWTLMGHEFVEMKNSEAAIEAYRRAVDLNRRDYRAWFGLGQAYELLSMHQYALHYYHRATALRPYDVRVWQAMAMCYTDLSRPKEAIECFKRAQIGADDRDTVLHLKIASLYDALGEFSSSASHHRQVVDICRREGEPLASYAKSCIYVARFYMSTMSSSNMVHQDDKNLSSGNSSWRNLAYAREYLQMVAKSNAEEGAVAGDLLKSLSGLHL